jgi:hypothetical protein
MEKKIMVVSLHYQVLGAIGISIERWTSGSSYLRPIGRLIEKKVFSGLVTACGLATWLTSLSPPLVIATMEGVNGRDQNTSM